MIAPIKVTGIAYAIDKATHKYVVKKIGHLDLYLPRRARLGTSAEVRLEQINHDHGNKYQAEIIVHIPGKTITAKDSTSNMLAAVDIVEAKIQAQLREYKQETVAHIGRRRIMSAFKRSFKREL